ncbi:LytR/AlgR family response regulator transcription factor [Chondrinema litorale]|uniref:LytR/AlgR family response regulator transcription factor n=1 Tax=Chondrinema litorale TaxID=2994555 RepID=UPI002542BEB2|nr:LytTR family DNA-binding domain-containing protein [Chondrinema litorale]UZR96678.1 LytTR family DNA-binding domain-containing protein [Chondrinema litorale]
MITCLIVDDEQGAINILKEYIERTPFLKLIETTTNPMEVLQLVNNHQIDLIFMDIQMPHLTGIDLIKMLGGKCKVIFTTAYSEFAIEGFEYEALDYLLKPIPFQRFLTAAQKALNKDIFNMPDWQPEENEDDYIFVKTENKGKMVKVNFKDITYVEGLKNYVSIYTSDGERVVTLLNIKDLKARLPEKKFMRVHRSYIVALDQIKAVDGNQILLYNMKAYLPLGDTYRQPFFEVLKEKIMGGKK